MTARGGFEGSIEAQGLKTVVVSSLPFKKLQTFADLSEETWLSHKVDCFLDAFICQLFILAL